MPLTDYSTDIAKVRLLADDDGSTATFNDAQVQAALDISDGSVYLAAALLLDKKAAAITALSTSQGVSVRIGDYSQQSTSAQTAAAYKAAADELRQLEYNTPALAIAEENFGEFSQEVLVRDYLLRNFV